MFLLNNKLINIDSPYTTPAGIRYGDLRNPDDRATLGIVEVPEEAPPEDYSEKLYYRTEDWDTTTGPYIVYKRKPDEQIKQTKIADLKAEIDTLEGNNPMARPTREFMILTLEEKAVAAGFTTQDLYDSHFAYRKVKDLDNKIAGLRAQLAEL